MLLRRHNTSLFVRTPAKLNLFLEVLGKRVDGFHDLESLMIKVRIYDDLSISPAPQLSLTADLSRLPVSGRISAFDFCSAENLILQAARLLQQKTGTDSGARIHVRKRIPLESGLAGGSSDAAAVLVGLNEFWNLKLSLSELQDLSAGLGSDVPFFFTPGVAAICRGRGERVEPLPAGPELAFIIVRPESGLSTPLVFKSLGTLGEAVQIGPVCDSWLSRNRGLISHHLFNRLQSPAEKLNPDVVSTRRIFESLPVIAHQMSGSGTSYFGICHNLRHARILARKIQARRCGTVYVADCGA